jgi:hypothetical protein
VSGVSSLSGLCVARVPVRRPEVLPVGRRGAIGWCVRCAAVMVIATAANVKG